MHQVMLEAGQYQRSLTHLQQHEDQICDILSFMEAKGNIALHEKKLQKIGANHSDLTIQLCSRGLGVDLSWGVAVTLNHFHG